MFCKKDEKIFILRSKFEKELVKSLITGIAS